VHPDNRHKFAVNTHRGQETIAVVSIGFKNAAQYCQQKGDAMLRDLLFAKTYINDFIVFSNTFKEHLQHLNLFFSTLAAHNVTLLAKKAFLGFPSLKLLGTKVDALRCTITADRIAALKNLKFPKTAADLKKYISVTGYLRNKVPYLAQLQGPLQDLKT
jgi:hypothetical protein